MKRGIKHRLWNFTLVISSIIISLILAEIIFRAMLFSKGDTFKFLRKPEYYARIYDDHVTKIFTDEYWKLYYRFDRSYTPPDDPHPLLGWAFKIDHETLIHPDAVNINNRRPVLLYGDSFSNCSSKSVCFEDILNVDPEFSSGHYLLNYGIGGYCVGQISLLLENSKKKYEKPVVIFGFMNRDIERSILTVRIGQKPGFAVKDDSLVIRGLPIEPHPKDFFRKNPPGITSYLYRKFLSSKLNFFPKSDRKVNKIIKEIKEVNEKIIVKTIQDLRKDGDDFFVLVFQAMYHVENDWRNMYIREILEKEGVPYIWTKDLADRDTTFKKYVLGDYQLDDGHPTTHFNQLIAGEIKKYVLDSAYRIEASKRNTQIYLEQKRAQNQ
jgi:hypothetical protein